jgi:hypothetical protein
VLDKLADNKFLSAVEADATATEAWVAVQVTAGKMDELTEELALACPRASRAAMKDLRAKILAFKDLLVPVPTADSANVIAPHLMLRLTQLKYGDDPSQNPKAMIEKLRKDINLRLDAIFTGCAHLFPKEQVREVMVLAGKAGVLGASGGSALPLLGILP